MPTNYARLQETPNNEQYADCSTYSSQHATLIDYDSDSDYEEIPRFKPTNTKPPSRSPPPPPLPPSRSPPLPPPRSSLFFSTRPPSPHQCRDGNRHHTNTLSPRSHGQQHGKIVPGVAAVSTIYIRDTLRTNDEPQGIRVQSSRGQRSATLQHRSTVRETTKNTSGPNVVRLFRAYDNCTSVSQPVDDVVQSNSPTVIDASLAVAAPPPTGNKQRHTNDFLPINTRPLVHGSAPGSLPALDLSTSIDGKDAYLRHFDGWNPSTLDWLPHDDASKSVGLTNQGNRPNIATGPPSHGVHVQVVRPLRTPMTPSSILALYSDHVSASDSSSSGRTSSGELHSKTAVSSLSAVIKSNDAMMWQTAADVPLEVGDFTVEQVRRSLELLRMPKLASQFEEQAIDGRLMMSIVTEESLVRDFHCSMFEARKLIEFFKNKWRPKC